MYMTQKKSEAKKNRNRKGERKTPLFTNAEFPLAQGLVPYIPYEFIPRSFTSKGEDEFTLHTR